MSYTEKLINDEIKEFGKKIGKNKAIIKDNDSANSQIFMASSENIDYNSFIVSLNIIKRNHLQELK